MKAFNILLGIGSCYFLSSCSCSIYHKQWQNHTKHKRITESMIAEVAQVQGFTKLATCDQIEYDKRNAFVAYSDREQALVFHSSFCPLPWEFALDRSDHHEIKVLQQQLLEYLKNRGIRMKQRMDE